jgi:hypothetical protein
MSYRIDISSDDRPSGQTSDDFVIHFSPAIYIPGNWVIAIHELSIWYSWYNISTDYNNQVFRYYNGSSYKNITIPNGLYSIENLNDYVHAIMKSNGDYTVVGGIDTFDITLTPNYNTFKLDISISNSYRVDLTVGTLYQLFGFDAILVTSSQSGTSNINITNGVDKILIHCDIATGGYKSGQNSDVLMSFQANNEPSSLLEIKPFYAVFLPITQTGYLTKMRIYITDQQNRRINLNNEGINMTLELKKLK